MSNVRYSQLHCKEQYINLAKESQRNTQRYDEIQTIKDAGTVEGSGRVENDMF